MNDDGEFFDAGAGSTPGNSWPSAQSPAVCRFPGVSRTRDVLDSCLELGRATARRSAGMVWCGEESLVWSWLELVGAGWSLRSFTGVGMDTSAERSEG